MTSGGLCGNIMVVHDGMSTEELSSSMEVLKVNWQHTGLWCDWLVPVLCGITGSKETFSSFKTWCILEALLSEVGMLKLSLPLSYPSSSNARLLSNVALNVVTK